MAPAAAALPQSDSKVKFMRRLGLDETNKVHRYLYSLMKAEAVSGWTRMTANRDALVADLKNDPKISPPYAFSQLDEKAVHKEILNIYRNARSETRILYNLGHDTDGDIEENWIIRWLIWHVFRYRDDRNSASSRRRGQSGSPGTNVDDEEIPADIPGTVEEVSRLQAVADASHQPSGKQSQDARTRSPSTRYWDPIREEYRERPT